MRPHVAAVYAFARIADDLADEGTAAPAERQAALHAWQDRLHHAVEETGSAVEGEGEQLVIVALVHSIRSLDLPISLFDDLISAFGQDTMTTRYASWADVFDYCRRSANPVGRLVLRIAGYPDGEPLARSSDALCTALQLTNFWQDFGRDWRAGRLYVPLDEQRAAGASEADLAQGRMTDSWARTIERCVAVTKDMFADGRSVCDGVSGQLGLELRLTWLGGARILERVERTRGTLLDRRPALGRADAPLLVWRALRWRKVRGAGAPGVINAP